MDLITDLKEKLKKAVFTTAEKKEGTKNLFIVSDETVDRQGETIAIDGWDLINYKKNPILLWSHNPEEPAIGQTETGYKTINGKKRLTAKPSFHRKSDLSRLISDLVGDGVIKGLSPGFLPKEYDEDGNYIKQELLEISFCNIPANPNALAMASAKGYDQKTLEKVFSKDKAWKYHKCKKCGFSRKVKDGATYKSMECPSCQEGLIKSMKRFKRIKPMEIIDEKPYPNEHACRLVSPDKFDSQSFRRMKRDHNGKEYSVIMGKLKDSSKMSDQAYRYSKDKWSSSEAKSHCTAHNGISFEPASKTIAELEVKAREDIGEIEKKPKVKKVKKIKKLADKVKEYSEKIDKLIDTLEKRDKIIEQNNKKVQDEFTKLKIKIGKSKGYKVNEVMDKKIGDIESNIKDLAEGLRSFTRGTGDGLRSRKSDGKAEERKRNRRLINKALNLIVEASNKEKNE